MVFIRIVCFPLLSENIKNKKINTKQISIYSIIIKKIYYIEETVIPFYQPSDPALEKNLCTQITF